MYSRRLFEHRGECAALLSMLGNEKRLAIMCHLVDQEMTVGAIAHEVVLSQSALSQHLAKLRAMGLVRTRRDRQMIYYSCSSKRARMLIDALDEMFASEDEDQCQETG